MCTNPFTLSFIFIIKILILIGIPVFLIIFRNGNIRINKYIFISYLVVIITFIILLLFNNSCIKNSTILGIIRSNVTVNDTYVYETKDYNSIDYINTDDLYKTRNNKDVYYYSNNFNSFSNKKVLCDNKEISMENYGYLITTMTTMLSTTLGRNINLVDVMNLVYYNEIIDCEKGLDFNRMINLIQKEYNVTFKDINASDIYNYLNDDVVILEKIEYRDNANINLTCDKGYIILYKYDNNEKIKVLDSNNKYYDYICPDDTRGSLSIIKSDTNGDSYSFEDLTSIGTKYMIMEAR